MLHMSTKDSNVRTTLTLDDDLARKLHDRAHREGRSFKHVTNEALRAGLEAAERGAGARGQLVIRARARGFRPGIDPARLNQLVDELQVDEFTAQAQKDDR